MLIPATAAPAVEPRDASGASERAFTLVEMVVAMIILMVVLGIVMSILVNGLGSQARSSAVRAADNESQIALDQVAADIRSADDPRRTRYREGELWSAMMRGEEPRGMARGEVVVAQPRRLTLLTGSGCVDYSVRAVPTGGEQLVRRSGATCATLGGGAAILAAEGSALDDVFAYRLLRQQQPRQTWTLTLRVMALEQGGGCVEELREGPRADGMTQQELNQVVGIVVRLTGTRRIRGGAAGDALGTEYQVRSRSTEQYRRILGCG